MTRRKKMLSVTIGRAVFDRLIEVCKASGTGRSEYVETLLTVFLASSDEARKKGFSVTKEEEIKALNKLAVLEMTEIFDASMKKLVKLHAN